MSKKIFTLFALILCMGAFLLPMSAFAAADTEIPTLTAKLNGETLHIETADNVGVEAVFIDGSRINYRIDGTVEVRLRDYAGTGKTVKIYAVDFAGNKSKETEITNPFYTAPAPAQTPTPAPSTPATPTPAPAAPTPSAPVETPEPSQSAVTSEPNPFTPSGTGTVMDNATDGDGKEFFTITTADENIFYLIIDRQRDNENVYLLNVVTEDDLMALAEPGSNQSAIPTPVPEPIPQPTPEPTPAPEPAPPEKESGSSGTVLLILLIALGAGGAGYYFKILKPKQEAALLDEDEYEEDFDDFDDYGEDDYSFEEDSDTVTEDEE